MPSRLFSLLGSLAIACAAALPASAAFAAEKDREFFQSVAGLWSGPGEIVAGKYKGTKFTCNLTGEPADGSDVGIKLGGTCRVGVFSQPMNAVISLKGNSYQGKFLDGADGKGLDIVSGQITGSKAVMGINRQKLNGAMVASVEDDKAMNITISVKVEDRMIPVIGLRLNRQMDQTTVSSIKE
ncbi:hypothetical protein [Rhizobium paknamense]|uniref:Uncharacterized protein n=1 Tax=Rhizobium paknamense TaxID=1206817 RepID=A0ABU0I6J6_9HYPH|nr:hypothetical protein [Rhizobium paknamense]MDQ0453839.1 hypothetical protein [Rhizobium paknamense]